MSRQRRSLTTRPPARRPLGRWLVGLPLVAVAVAVSLAGCTGHTDRSGPVSMHDQQLRFARCMRDHGVDMPDPGADGAGAPIAIGGVGVPADDATGDPSADASGATAGGDAHQQAFAACRKFMPKAPDPSPISAADREAMLTFARCMREHGVEYPDPPPVGYAGAVAAVGIDLDNQVATDALRACDPSFSAAPVKPGPSR